MVIITLLIISPLIVLPVIEPLFLTIILPIAGIILLIGLIILVSQGLLIGLIKGAGVRVSEKQFPDLHKVIIKQCQALGIKNIPKTYIIESAILNAFATRFAGSNYMILFSELAELILSEDVEKDVVDFVVAHELGHIKRNHITKKLLVYPSLFVPFLPQAYSRACEYTCDRIGTKLSPTGAVAGIKMLAAGKKLARKLNVKAYAEQTQQGEAGFWTWISEKLSTHPHLSKRITPEMLKADFIATASGKNTYFEEKEKPKTISSTKESIDDIKKAAKPDDYQSDDHNKYLPK
ncbi:M48 family metallopeptidase [Spongiivirga sp. MCCC 1A20706]|uniref:M48 family metallopeptidase n=1 Tax=Spongiivirga sp. MCCC 1A20706 TaxID=3160963 RepID=UPI00397741ED